MRSRSTALLLILALAISVLLARVWWYWPFFEDDSFISLRYAQRLLSGHGLTWTDAERVEGYSNLLWILSCAALGALKIDLVDAARLLGGALSIGTLAVLVLSQRTSRAPLIGVAIVAIGLAGTDTFGAWAVAGLEQPLLAFLVACAVAGLIATPERPKVAGLFLGLAALTRPDAMLFAVIIAVSIVLSRPTRAGIVRALPLVAIPTSFYVGQLAFRVAYYGDWVPNTARVKVILSTSHVTEGLKYVADGCLYQAPLLLAIPVAIYLAFRNPLSRERLLISSLPVLVWLAYLVSIGGDIFPAHRHFEPALALCAFAAMDVFELVPIRPVAVGILAAALIALQILDPAGHDAKKEGWEWDMKTIGEFLKSAFAGKSPVIAVDAAGALPYYSEFPAIDMLGLNDRWIATHRPIDIGTGRAAHELGDGKYVLSRHPDLVFVNTPRKSYGFYFRSEIEMSQQQEFYRDYRFLEFDPGGPFIVTMRMWVRLTSPVVGIRRTERGVEIPGMFFAGDRRILASLDDHGVLATRIPKGLEARLAAIPVPKGRWKIEVDATGPYDIQYWGGTNDPWGPTGLVSLPDDGDVQIELKATTGDVVVRSVTLVKTTDGSRPANGG